MKSRLSRIELPRVIEGLFIGGLILFFGWFYTFHLGYKSLESFDEAWYAVIARNMVRTGDTFLMDYNGYVFTDHPPAGIWLMAVSFKLFGISELSARLPAALLGVGSLVFLYLLGKRLYSRTVGMSAALMLGTALWFVLRARSGNLDATFIFWSVSTLWLCFKARDSIRFLPLVAASFALLCLTKTLVGFFATPLLFVLVWPYLRQWRVYLRWLLASGLVWLAVVLPWYVINAFENFRFLKQHFFEIGLRQRSLASLVDLNLREVLFYLQIGLGKWYKLFLTGLPLLLFSRTKWRSHLFVLAWLLVVSLPFITTPKTEIWHLIPIYPVAVLIASAGWWGAGMSVLNFLTKRGSRISPVIAKNFLATAMVVGVTMIATIQIKNIWSLVISPVPHESAEAKISKSIKKYDGYVHLKEWFLPAALFYADQEIDPMGWKANALQDMIKTMNRRYEVHIFLIHRSAVDELRQANVEFTILEQVDDYFLISNQI